MFGRLDGVHDGTSVGISDGCVENITLLVWFEREVRPEGSHGKWGRQALGILGPQPEPDL